MTQEPFFDFPEAATGLEDIADSESNALALKVLKQPDTWPMRVICVTGPARSGLTTIAKAWSEARGGGVLSAAAFDQLKDKDRSALLQSPLAIDDADRLTDFDALLNLINQFSAGHAHLLLVAHTSPAHWPTGSADLLSRLKSMPVVEIHDPDERMLTTRLSAEAERYFLKLEDDVLDFVKIRLERSYEAIEVFIRRLNEEVIAAKRAPSVPLARRALEGMGEAGEDQPRLL